MTLRTWAIQLLGLLVLLAILLYALPKLATAVSGGLEASVSRALRAQGLDWASVQAHGRDIVLGGSTLSPEAHQQAVATAKATWFVKNVQDGITPAPVRPYRLTMQKADGKLAISGYFPSDADKQTLSAMIQRTFPGLTITSDLKTGVGAPEGWLDLSKTLLTETAKLDTAYIGLNDQTLEITGKAPTTAEAESFQKTLQAFSKQHYQVNIDLIAADHAKIVCQQKFNELLGTDKIYFETGKAIIEHKSDPLLQKLTDTAIFCAHSKIIIAGHTDDIGSDQDNQELSYHRAQAVKGALFTLGGIPMERLEAIGKGATEPVGPNDTEAGRAQNRRIEFIVEDMK